MEEIVTDPINTKKKITSSGGSLVINVTKEVKLMGLKRGDEIAIKLNRLEE